MKKTRKLLAIILSLVMIFTALPLTAVTSFAVTSGDFEYEILDDGTAVITGYTGTATELTIPSEIDGYTVTSIGEWAFEEYTSLESITIPDIVTSIGNGAFCGCTSLTSINVNTGNENYVSVDGVLFNKDKTELICYPAGKEATTYAIPDSVISIGNWAFEDCTSLESITIGNSVTSIGNSAFGYCTSLKSITIPDSVTSIDWHAFEACELLESITIPDSVTYIGDNAFYKCTSLTSINVNAGNENYASVDGVLFNKDKTELICYPEGKEATAYAIPDGVTSIDDGAFKNCTLLESITIPDSVTSIGSKAFSKCTSLESITIPDGITSIGRNAFYNTAYYNNEANWENDVLYIGNHLIKAKDTVSGDYTIKDGTRTIADEAFEACESLASITIPDSVTNIGYIAFYFCTSLASVTIPDSVTSIGYSAFSNCTSLESITIGNGVTSIGDEAFESCESLTSITIPDSVTSIGTGAFYNCTSLESITIPDSVTSIGDWAFSDCTSLASITIPDSVTNIGDYAFGYYYDYEIYETCKVEGFTIYGYVGSEAERYANDNEFAFVALEKPAPSGVIGDVNGDGKLSTVDAKWILQNLASTRDFTDEQKAFADVNGDGKISVVDAKWILQALAGLRDTVTFEKIG